MGTRNRSWIDDFAWLFTWSVYMKTEAIMPIRWITYADLDEVMEIETASFQYPLTRIEFIEWLKCDDVVCLVHDVKGDIAGFMMYVFDNRMYHIINMAVRPEYRLQGIAAELVNHLKGGLIGTRQMITASVRDRNKPALKMFKKLGFRNIERDMTYKMETKEGVERVWRLKYRANGRMSLLRS